MKRASAKGLLILTLNALRLAGAGAALVALAACLTSTTTYSESTVELNRDGSISAVVRTRDANRPNGPVTESFITVQPALEQYVPRRAKLSLQMDGLFVGISDHGPKMGSRQTPGHAVAAFAMYNLFRHSTEYSWFPNATSNSDDGLTLLSVLSLDPHDRATTPDILASLSAVGGGRRSFWDYTEGFDLDHGKWSYIGREDRQVTKQELLKTVEKHVDDVMTGTVHGSSSGSIFYIAAHGTIGPDGRPWIFASDSDPNDPATWISYVEIATAYRRMIDAGREVVLIFDTCQTLDTASSAPAVADWIPQAFRRPNVSIVTSAAAGQYAWSLTSSADIRVQRHTESSDGTRRGPSTLRGRTNATQMSLFPVAMLFEIKKAQDAAKTGGPSQISLRDILRQTPGTARELLASNPRASGFAQDVKLYLADGPSRILDQEAFIFPLPPTHE